MDKNKITVAGVLVSVVLAVYAVFNSGATVINNPVTEITKLGAAGQDFPGPCVSVNGLTTCSERRGFTVATTTICAIKSPNATSSLAYTSVNFAVSSTSASVITVAKATTPFATTTGIGSQLSLAANATIMYPQYGTSSAAFQFAPGQYLVVGMQGGASNTTFSPVGSCEATFIVQ